MHRPSELEQEATESQHRRLALGMRDNLAQNLVALKLDITMLHARTGATPARSCCKSNSNYPTTVSPSPSPAIINQTPLIRRKQPCANA